MTAQTTQADDIPTNIPQQQIEKLNREFLACWELCTSPFPASEIVDQPDLATRYANIAFRFYNALCLMGSFTDESAFASTVNRAAAYMRSKPAPGWMVVTLDSLSDEAESGLAELMRSNDLTSMPLTGMAGDILPLESRPHPPLRFERILDDAVLTDFVDLNCLAYGFPIEAGRSLLGQNAFWREHAYGFVAYEGDLPVSTATGVVCEGCIFLLLVATRPESQRKGYGEAVVRHALNAAHAATGIRRTSLQGTDMGRSVYARLGYREVCRYVCLWPTPRE